MNITKKQQLVLNAIKRNPEAADDDAMLLAEVWTDELAAKGISVDTESLYGILRRVSRAESLTRRRRELFNAELIEYTPGSSKRRMTAYRAEKSNAGFAARFRKHAYGK